MDHGRFDRLARGLAHAAEVSTRRGAFARLGGLALLAAVSSRREMAAVGSGTCRAASPNQFISKHACVVLLCGTAPECLCVQTLGHNPVCVTGFNPTNRNDCPKTDECNEVNRPCRAGFVCAKVGSCCKRRYRKCLSRCPA